MPADARAKSVEKAPALARRYDFLPGVIQCLFSVLILAVCIESLFTKVVRLLHCK